MTAANFCLTLFDTSGIQEYVFGSNRLKENVGASYLVGAALDQWLEHACQEAVGGRVRWRRVADAPGGLVLPANTELDAELIYAAGGNAAVLFRSREQAVRAVQHWSKRLLLDAPGLRVTVAHQEFAAGDLHGAWQRALEALTVAKAGAPLRQPLEGLSLTRSCRSTGLAAAGWASSGAERDLDPNLSAPARRAVQFLSPQAACRLAAVDAANDQLLGAFQGVLKGEFTFTEDVEQLGQQEREHHLAVVHADGNGLGKRFREQLGPGEDDAVARRVRDFARCIHIASQQALRATLTALAGSHDSLRKKGMQVHEMRHRFVLPCRPILYGGDDVTFVCHGKLGLSLAAVYLRRFAEGEASDGKPLSACAGVAIAHMRAPFSRVYELADDLCKEAKRWARADGEAGSSWLDAHLALEGPGEPLEQVRARRTVRLRDGTAEGALDWRPWRVTPAHEDDRDWDSVAGWMRQLQQRDADGPLRWPASVRRGLLDSLAAGPSASEAAIAHQRWRGRALPEPRTASVDAGWCPRPTLGVKGASQATPYYDPLELVDYFWEVGE